jgi:hypothetical protein
MPTGESTQLPWSPDQWDLDGDSAFTIADAAAWLERAFFVPGDWAIWWLVEHQPAVAQFLLVDESSYGTLFSGLVSAFLWLSGLLAGAIVVRAFRAFDDALTLRIRICYDEIVRRVLVARRIARRVAGTLAQLVIARVHRPPEARDAGVGIELAEQVDLGASQRALLQALLEVPAPYALSLAEIAEAQNLSRTEANGLIRALRSLNFVSQVGSGAYEEQAFAITRSGRAYLQFRHLGARGA